MSWLLFALLSALFFGVAQVFIKKGFTSLSPLWNIIFEALIVLLLFVPVGLITGVSFPISLATLGAICLITFLYSFFYYAIEKGQISLSGTVFATYPVFTIFFAYFFLREEISLLQWSMIVAILLGIVLLSYTKGTRIDVKNKKNMIWLSWALLGSATTGFGDFFAKVTLSDVSIGTYIFLFPFAYILSTLFFWALDKKGRKLPKKLTPPLLKNTGIGVLLLCLGILSLTYALSTGSASIVSVVSSSYIALSAVLAYIFLKEKLTPRQIIGIIFVCVGVVAIGL